MTLRSTRIAGMGMILPMILALPCHAADAEMFRGSALKAGAPHNGRTLSVAELDACLDIENEVTSLKSTIDQSDLFASVAESRYRGLAQVIDAKRSFLDTSDQEDIDDFNLLVKEQSDAVDAYNALVVPLNEAVGKHTSAVERFNAQCAEIDYYESDLVKAYSVRERRLAASMDKKSGTK